MITFSSRLCSQSLIPLLLGVALLFSPAQANQGPLNAQMTAWKIDQQNGKETRLPVTEARPGDVLEYEMVYHNTGTKPLTGVVVMGPVPDHTEFVPNSALPVPGAVLEVSLDDGKNWQAEPVLREVVENGVARKVPVPATEYTALRWVEAGALEPGMIKTYRYRVRVE